MANTSSLNTLYSLINGPNADRIGGFIYNAQVDDAARQREATRQADASIALGNKQAEYSLASALSRSPETAAMFQPGREVLAPDMQDMAYNLAQQVPAMQGAELKSKQADYDYKLALTDRARREPVGSGGDKGITAYQQAQLDREDRRLDQTAASQTEQRALRILDSGERQALGYDKLANDAALLNKAQSAIYAQRAQAIREKAASDAEALYSRQRSSGKPTPTGESLVQPTAAPQAKAPATPSNDERAIRVQQAKQHYMRLANDPQGRAELLKRAASMGITEKDLQ